jgi:CDP-diacylglycerol--serine O-phosphatidyltransferase
MAEDNDFDNEVAEVAVERRGLGGLRRRGIYLLPNLFTTGVLFCGFFAIVQAMNGRFDIAAIAVYVAMVLDGMDGRVARWTNTQSEFGAQYDSIADMVAFGAAPALIAYEWALKDLGTATSRACPARRAPR